MPVPMSMNNEVLITCGERGCKVSRAFVISLPGKTVRFVNQTKKDVFIHVSHDKVFKTSRFSLTPGQDKTLTVRRVQRGIYPFAVFCKCNGEFCTGSSMPIIIVPR